MSTNTNATEKKIHRQMTIEAILSMFPHKAQRLSQEITNASCIVWVAMQRLGKRWKRACLGME